MNLQNLIFSFLICATIIAQDQGSNRIFKTLDDDNSKYTNVGNIGITITNFGTYGHGFTLWPEQPSCEYPIGSGIEHIFDGGLWIGGFIRGNSVPFVTTGAVDAASVSSKGGGFEYTNTLGSKATERSNLIESKFYSPFAISHQDLMMLYSDTSKTYLNGELIENHEPLGLVIRQENYSWNYPFADYFVIFNYYIKNASNKNIDSVYIGMWTDAVVRNTNITSPRTGTSFFNKGGNGYNDSLKIAYEFDATGDVGFTDSYIGAQYLGASIKEKEVNFVCWQFRNADDPNFFMPTDDIERYKKMNGYFGGSNKYGAGINPSILKPPSNRSMLITAGPFTTIAPGDSINITFAIVCAKKYGSDLPSLDTEEQKTNLYANAGWAIRAYNGEDRNGNGILDPGEDTDGDGKITRYILPSPPRSPKLLVVPENQKATLYWDKRAEKSIDPISGKKDFEGYRLYRTNAGFDLTESQNILESIIKLAEFDSLGNDVGFNTGFALIELNTPVQFDGDTTKYYYKYEIDNLLNGWQYIFSVTAFDKGDIENGITSLESGILPSSQRVIPGTPPTSEEDVEIGVYPNPYYGEAYWDGSSERLRKIYFFNLPEQCEITIYTLSGDVIKKLQHDQTSNGSDLRWFETYGDGTQKFTGGEHAWDLVTDYDQAIASGLYLFTVKDAKTGNVKTGKFLIIK